MRLCDNPDCVECNLRRAIDAMRQQVQDVEDTVHGTVMALQDVLSDEADVEVVNVVQVPVTGETRH